MIASAWLTVGAAALAAGMVQGICGFGQGILFMLVLPGLFGVIGAGSLSLCCSLLLCCFMAFLYRRRVKWRVCLKVWACYLPASFLSLILLKQLNADGLRPALGLLLTAVSVYGVFFRERVKLKPTLTARIICSGCSAVMDMLFGIGGPPMVMYVLSETADHGEYLGTYEVIAAGGCAAVTAMRMAFGLFPFGDVQALPVMVLCMLCGILITRPLVKRIDRRRSGLVVYSMIGIAGLITFFRYI